MKANLKNKEKNTNIEDDLTSLTSLNNSENNQGNISIMSKSITMTNLKHHSIMIAWSKNISQKQMEIQEVNCHTQKI